MEVPETIITLDRRDSFSHGGPLRVQFLQRCSGLALSSFAASTCSLSHQLALLQASLPFVYAAPRSSSSKWATQQLQQRVAGTPLALGTLVMPPQMR